jgi:hypothetical protein
MTTSRTSIVNIHCPPSSHGWQVESGYYSDSYNNNSTSSMSNTKKQTSSSSSSQHGKILKRDEIKQM